MIIFKDKKKTAIRSMDQVTGVCKMSDYSMDVAVANGTYCLEYKSALEMNEDYSKIIDNMNTPETFLG